MTQYYSCRLTYESSAFKYIFWAVSGYFTIVAIRLFHECLHGLFSLLTGGAFGQISIFDWVLIIPIFQISDVGGNPFWSVEGVLIVTWLVCMILIYVTSFSFLSRIYDWCKALDLSGWLTGIRIGAAFEGLGEVIYALPNFVFFTKNGTVIYGDGTVMAHIFEEIGYSADYQYVIAAVMLVGAVAMLWYSLRCDPNFCYSCGVR